MSQHPLFPNLIGRKKTESFFVWDDLWGFRYEYWSQWYSQVYAVGIIWDSHDERPLRGVSALVGFSHQVIYELRHKVLTTDPICCDCIRLNQSAGSVAIPWKYSNLWLWIVDYDRPPFGFITFGHEWIFRIEYSLSNCTIGEHGHHTLTILCGCVSATAVYLMV